MSEPKLVDFKLSWMKKPDAATIDDCPNNGSIPIPDDDSLPAIELHQRYRHRDSGRIYIVSEFLPTCDDDDWVDGVLYMSVESGERFVQPLDRFKRRMEKVT